MTVSSPIVRPRTAAITFLLLYLAFCLSFIDRSAMALALTAVAKDFHLDDLQKGTVLSAFYLGFALMQFPGGWLADRFGSRPVVIVTILAWSIFTILSSTASALMMLIAIRFAFGLAEGAFPSASMKTVAELFVGDRKPRMSSLLLSSNYVGSMFAPLLITPLMLAVGWRHSFQIVGVLGFVLVIAYFLIAPRGARAEERRAETAPPIPVSALLRIPLLWQLTIAWFGMSCINKGLDAWMPTYLLEARKLDLRSVGLLTPLPYLMATIATAIGGWVMLRFFDGREKYLLILSATLTGLFLWCMYRAQSVGGVIFFQSLVYFFKSFTFVTVVALPIKMIATERVGTGVGLVNAGGQAAGFVAPLVMGALLQATGSYNVAFLFLIAMTVLALVVALSIRGRNEGAPAG